MKNTNRFNKYAHAIKIARIKTLIKKASEDDDEKKKQTNKNRVSLLKDTLLGALGGGLTGAGVGTGMDLYNQLDPTYYTGSSSNGYGNRAFHMGTLEYNNLDKSALGKAWKNKGIKGTAIGAGAGAVLGILRNAFRHV